MNLETSSLPPERYVATGVEPTDLGAKGTVAPSVSVVMPVYNQEKYVADAIKCILQQTFSDFEFVIVDDGSTDRTLDIVESFRDDRIRIVRKDHSGFIATLARGYEEAKGKWIARMDSDDLCTPERLERQMQFIENHPECGFVGTAYGYTTPNGLCAVPSTKPFVWRYIDPEEITLGGRVFGDSTVVFRRDLAEKVGFYDPEFNNENPLWYRLLNEAKGVVLGEPLYLCRWVAGTLSRTVSNDLSDAHVKIRAKYDPANVHRLEHRRKDHPDKRTVGMLKRALFVYFHAGDRAASRRLAWTVWRAKPFSPVRLKMLAYAIVGVIGVRSSKMSKASSALVGSPSPVDGGSLTARDMET